MSTQVLSGEHSGRHIVDGPLTVAVTNEAVPGLIRNTIDRRIVKVRPMATPIDQISRCAGARPTRSMTVEYYSVDPKKPRTTVAADVPAGLGKRRSDGIYTHSISTKEDNIFEPSETLMLPDVIVGVKPGSAGEPLVVYVLERNADTGLEVIAINADLTENGKPTIPAIPEGSPIVRMGRAATELDVQTAQFQALPTKKDNNCQIFKMQVEESTFHKIADKEAGWSFSDQEEAAIIDMRMGMEKNFLFGAKSKIVDPVKNEEVYLTGGIWNQTDNDYQVDCNNFTEKTLIDIAQKAFTGNCGSKRKLLICGSELMGLISKIDCQRIRRSNDSMIKWGLTFNQIVTNFGNLYIVHAEVFDQCGHEWDGMVIDLDYLTKYVHIPFHTEKLDLRRSGTRNTSAVVITEASCLVLRHPQSHLRVIRTKPVEES